MKSGSFSRIVFYLGRISPGLLAILLLACIPAAAQLSSTEPDPLARIREAANSNVLACSATGQTLCEQVAPKIVANAQGDSPLAENLRRLDDSLQRPKAETSAQAAAIAWALSAFQDAGLDAHSEKYADPNGGPAELENVVAEFRGRENPDDWVLVGAHLGPMTPGPGAVDNSCDAAELIEAARDISRTSVHPRISIRFVLFTGEDQTMPGSWAYVRSHRAELDHARAAIVFRSNCRRVSGYFLNGRPQMEAGVQEAMKPIESMSGNHLVSGTLLIADNFDFFLEGVPALTALPVPEAISANASAATQTHDRADLTDLKRNTAFVAVTAFGIAERAAPLGPRQSRAEIESLLKTWDQETQMNAAGLWAQWESGRRGRLP